jgi:hypothetical protein
LNPAAAYGRGKLGHTTARDLSVEHGSIVSALHWNEDSSDADNKVLAGGFPGLGLQAAFAAPANVQFMVKDSKK